MILEFLNLTSSYKWQNFNCVQMFKNKVSDIKILSLRGEVVVEF